MFDHENAKAGLVKWSHLYGFSDREKARKLSEKINEKHVWNKAKEPIHTQFWEEGKVEDYHAVHAIDPRDYVYGTTWSGETKLIRDGALVREFAKAAGYDEERYWEMPYQEASKWMVVWCECWMAGYYAHEKHEFSHGEADKAGEGHDYVVVEDLS